MEKVINANLIEEKYKLIVYELLSKLKAHSEESYTHSFDVAEKAYALAHSFGIGGEDVKKLYTASLLHDIGKIFIDRDLLHKKNATDEETEIIRLGHIQGTKQILKEYFDDKITKLAIHHHERLDHSGYPEHLGSKKLSILDRILQVADVTSALEMSRSYKKAYDFRKVIHILDGLVECGELDRNCVEEIKKIYSIPVKGKSQLGS